VNFAAADGCTLVENTPAFPGNTLSAAGGLTEELL
jgi:hypothetical protein